jgi:predicted secreted protein
MATSARSSHGTLLKVGDGGTPTEVFSTIGEVKDISGPSMTLNTEDVTSHDSGGWKEEIPTLLEAGEISFDVNYYKAATQVALRSAQMARTRLNFQMVVPLAPTETLSFSGFVTGFEYSAPVEGILTASITIKVSGPVTSA